LIVDESVDLMLDRSTPPPIQPVQFNFRKPAERILRNGIPLYIIEAEGLGAVRVDFVFSAGQWVQARKLQALFACRMLREGCRGYSAAAFAERLDYYGAWLELSVAMNRTFVTLYTLKKHFAETIELVQRMLTSPSYSEEQFRIVRDNNKAQLLVNLQKGDVQAMRALRRNIYGESHPCGVQVNPEDYDSLQVVDIVDFYERHYGSHTCQIYLSGDVDDNLMALIESSFGNNDWGSSAQLANSGRELALCTADSPSKNIITHSGAVQDSIRMGCLLMDINDPDYLSMRVLTTVLGGYFGSRLMKNVREAKGYTYHIGADLITNTPQVMFLVHCEAQSGKADEVIEEVCNEISRLQTEQVSDEELRMVRNYMIGEICRNYESAFSLADAYIFMEHLGLSQSHLEKTIEAIHTTDASRLQELAQRYLHLEMLHTVVVRP
jgi:predicted Zn-dependent peptidase